MRVSVLEVFLQDTFRFPQLEKKKKTIQIPQQDCHHHNTGKAKLTSRHMRDAHFNEWITVSEKEDQEINRP